MNIYKVGMGLEEELSKQDKLTEEEEGLFQISCESKYGGADFQNYKKIATVLDKILNEVY
jgi:hypothetical protein